MSETINCDIAIIGAGAGGLSIAAVAAQLKLDTVLIENGKMGGDCLNYGCIPSKSLIAAAKSAHEFLTAGRFGIQPVTPNINFSSVMEHVAGVIKTIAVNDSVERFTKLGAHVISGHAEFIDDKTVKVNDQLICARRFVIATGSSAAIPPIPGLETTPYLTNETIFNLRETPEHLIIIGGGPIGCELAQAFRFLGVDVTILEAFSIMPKDEPDLVSTLKEKLINDGITIHEGVKVINVAKNKDNIGVTIDHGGSNQTIKGSHLLIAAGRRPNIQSLNLDKAGISHSNKGISVNAHLRTTNKRVYAIGDAIGGFQFTHIANYHAGIVIRNMIFKLPAKVNYASIPWVTYTTPELAHTGLTVKEAFEKYKNAQIIDIPFTENDRAQTEHNTLGKIKVVVTAKGKVLGCSILGSHAGELILPWIMLIKDGKSLRYISDVTMPYPTLNEISKRVASEFYSPSLFSSIIRKLVGLLKHF